MSNGKNVQIFIRIEYCRRMLMVGLVGNVSKSNRDEKKLFGFNLMSFVQIHSWRFFYRIKGRVSRKLIKEQILLYSQLHQPFHTKTIQQMSDVPVILRFTSGKLLLPQKNGPQLITQL